ncbi:MAG: SDR family oxidoreductase [Isosphaeraceae bacterium]
MRILVTGATGRLGSYVMARLALGAHDVVGWARSGRAPAVSNRLQTVDLTDAARFARAIRAVDPDVVLHLAAISSAEEVRREPRTAWEINVEATGRLVKWAIGNDRRLIFTSSDLVFDGTRSWYREDDPSRPILEYGRMKRAAELAVAASSNSLTVRVSLLYGKAPSGREGFFDRAVSSMRAGTPCAFFDDEHRTPLDYATAAGVLVKLAESNLSGLIHLGGPERLSRFELMRRAAVSLGIASDRVLTTSQHRQAMAEPRPADVSLDTTRLRDQFPNLTIPPIETALESFGR